ncbi:MAG: heparinase II/III family protein [Candidatus Hydrogenedentes bacterium]|nr:heparinase II/III family protein [Candidatus Hydrogenedentota bacterium]
MGMHNQTRLILCLAAAWNFLASANAAEQAEEPAIMKDRSAFYTPEIVRRAQENAAKFPWAAAMQKELVDRAAPWLNRSDDELWNSMFGPNITRSWMVWSDGYCPACKKDVKMYTWEMDPLGLPWKVRCPHCKETFPKNDFAAYHRSGLDEHGVFVPDRADRKLLFNTEHPDPNDPVHLFGVDDGEGYVADGHRWRFIGAYLIYGQWKRHIYAGIVNLSAAYIATGDARYAYKAALLLDRVADVFPGFDFGKQGYVYETTQGTRGQISTWHDACEEVRYLALSYDRVFTAAQSQESALVGFLSLKAAQYKLENPKKSWADIRRNIEERIFVDTLGHRERIESNQPRTDLALLVIKTVLNWPNNREEVLSLLDDIVAKGTAVDGLSGEKGLAGYTTIAPRAISEILAQLSRLEPDFLRTVYERHPVLHQTYRFHIDTHCLDEYYPNSGDSGAFAAKVPQYAGVDFSRNPGTEPSMFRFLWDMYELTKDPAFVQMLYRGNDGRTDGLPHDLFAEDPAVFQTNVQAVIDQVGTAIQEGSVNKQQWRLAVLRSGVGPDRRALWIDYDAGGRHSHMDGMNIGFFAKGLDLIPDFGYPPVGYGGWGAPKALWYKRTAAHVTVVVDGQDQKAADGKTLLWADGQRFRAIRVSAPEMIGSARYERTVVLADMNERDSYIIDVFHVVGGKDHAKYFHSHFGSVEVSGLSFAEASPVGNETEMRNFRRATAQQPGWSADWKINDYYKYVAPERNIHLRYTDFTPGAEVYFADGWIETTFYGGAPEWIQRLIVHRQADSPPLDSTFVSVIEPYENESNIATIRRLPLQGTDGQPLPSDAVALEIGRIDGLWDVCLLADVEHPVEMVDPTRNVHLDGQIAWLSFNPLAIERIALCQARSVRVGNLSVVLKEGTDFVELALPEAGAKIVSGSKDAVASIARDGTPLAVVND